MTPGSNTQLLLEKLMEVSNLHREAETIAICAGAEEGDPFLKRMAHYGDEIKKLKKEIFGQML